MEKTEYIHVRTTHIEKRRFYAACKRTGMVPAQMIRQLMAKYVKESKQ